MLLMLMPDAADAAYADSDAAYAEADAADEQMIDDQMIRWADELMLGHQELHTSQRAFVPGRFFFTLFV